MPKLKILMFFLLTVIACTKSVLLAQDSTVVPKPFKVQELIVIGNKKTKMAIIRRELLIYEGLQTDSLDFEERIQQSKINLNNTLLFNQVNINYAKIDSNNHVICLVEVKERWYLMPYIIFKIADRNFNAWWQDKKLSRLNYGLDITQYNFRGRKETLRLMVQHGFTKSLGFDYDMPYIHETQKLGIGFFSSIEANNEVAYLNKDNKRLFIKDYDKNIRRGFNAGFRLNFRNKLYSSHRLQFEFINEQVNDTVIKLNPHFFTQSITRNYFVSINYLYKRNRKDFKSYPLKGYYVDFNIVKHGIGWLQNTDIDILYAKSTLKYFQPLKERWYFSASLTGKISMGGFQPYIIQRALGYEDYLRAYELYVIDGQHFVMNKLNLKYALFPQTYFQLPFIRTEKFNTIPVAIYSNLFIDSGYVVDKQTNINNAMANQMLYGVGMGVDFVTYYDKVIRLEYSINKFAKHGFFLNFTAPI